MKKMFIMALLLGIHATSTGEANLPYTKGPLLFSDAIELSAAELKDYVGKYTFTTSGSPISNFEITEKQGELYGEADSYGANKLLKQAEEDKFVSTSSYGSTIIFLRNAQTKKVTGLQLIIQGNTLEATKDN